MRPSLVIPRIRTACPGFENRVAGASGLDDAMEVVMEAQPGLAVPCAIVLWEGDEPGNDVTLSTGGLGMDQELIGRFSVTVIVDGKADSRGQNSAERLIDARNELLAALVGWSPDVARFGACLYAGTADAPVYNRAYGACTFAFAAPLFSAAP